MHVIARMNVGGPAVLVADLIRSVDSQAFKQILITGYCEENESDYLDEVAKDVGMLCLYMKSLAKSLELSS